MDDLHSIATVLCDILEDEAGWTRTHRGYDADADSMAYVDRPHPDDTTDTGYVSRRVAGHLTGHGAVLAARWRALWVENH